MPTTVTSHERPHVSADLNQPEQQKTDAEHGQQIAVVRYDGAIDHDLRVERRRQREHLERGREQQHLRERGFEADHSAEQLRTSSHVAASPRV